MVPDSSEMSKLEIEPIVYGKFDQIFDFGGSINFNQWAMSELFWKWSYRRYRLWVISTDKEVFLYKWNNWKFLMPSIDKLLQLTNAKPFIRTSQAFEFESKWLGFGRMVWNEENNEKWTTKYRTAENESKLRFYGTEIWAPDWNQFSGSGIPPDIYIKLYNTPESLTTKEGLVIAIPRRLALKQKEAIEVELFRLMELIPNSILSLTTRFWYPWLRFRNNIEDMNSQELEKVIKSGSYKYGA